MFTITGGKGFHIEFENKYTVSVQFGPGNYGGNYDMPFDLARTTTVPPSPTAEVAVIDVTGKLIKLPGWDDNVQGYYTPADVLALLNQVAELPA